jgi:hypothetical protein
LQQGTIFQIFETACCHQPAVFSLGSAFAEVIGQILNDQLGVAANALPSEKTAG